MPTFVDALLQKRVACPVCGAGSSAWRKTYQLANARIMKCGCGMVFMDPFLGKEGMHSFYSQAGLAGELTPHFRSLDAGRIIRNKRDPLHRLYGRYLQGMEKACGIGKLLDVGCGDGLFLAMARARGWRVQGIDFGSKALQSARSGFQLEVSEGDFETADFPPASFRALAMMDFLEHAEDPLRILKKVYHVLEAGGVVLIALPNEASLLNKVADVFYRCSAGAVNQPVRMLHIIEHPSYFDARSLTRILEKGGFEVLEIRRSSTDSRHFNLPFVIKAGIAGLNAFGRLFGCENRLAVLARKKEKGSE